MITQAMSNIIKEVRAAKCSNKSKVARQCLGNLTVFQALWRQLKEGESRADLCKAVLSKRNGMHFCVAVKKRLAAEANMTLDAWDLEDDGDIQAEGGA